MKKKSMKVVSLILAIVMAISLLPLSALAEKLNVETRKVGVVVYGAEFTAILANVEKGIHGEGDLQESLGQLVDIATKVVDGTGISVPDVDVTLTSDTGKVYEFEEDKNIEIFTETTDIYMPFQDEMDKQLTKLEDDIASLKQAMQESNDLTAAIADSLDEVDAALKDTQAKLETVVHDVVTTLAQITGVNGILYRTYVTTEAVPVDETYTVFLKNFSDSDKDGNAITRDGYILYNDGLTEGGSSFNTERSFEVTINPVGRWDHDIQFVGPGVGIQGKLNIPEPLASLYNTTATTLNTLTGTLADIKNALLNKDNDSIIGALTGKVADIFAKITDTEAMLNWLKEWNAPELSTLDQLDLTYKFLFPGLWCAEYDAGFSFKNVDVAQMGIQGSEFLLVNRQETIDVLKFMLDLGKDAFMGAIKATFGGDYEYADGTVMTYDGITDLYTQLVTKNDEGQLALDYDTAYAIVKTYIGVIMDMNLFDRVVDTDNDSLLPKLRYPIPAILKATSDENGVVTFSKDSNMTLTWMLEIAPTITNALTKIQSDNKIVELFVTLTTYVDKVTRNFADFAEKAINLLVYPFAQRLGLVGPKLASGEYIMFQIKAADSYWINPIAYTMIMTWDNDGWFYSTVSDVGILTPYFAEDLYNFVRNTTFAGTLDKFMSQVKGEDVTILTDILNDNLDMTNATYQAVTGMTTALAAKVGFEALGLSNLFSNSSELNIAINKYLAENGRTVQNLMVYLNKEAKRAKAVYAGTVDENWYFYNLDKSPTTTAVKLIDKSTSDIAATFVNEKKSSAITKTGSAISQTVSKVGTAVETAVKNATSSVVSKVKSTVQSVAKSAVSNVVKTVSSFFSKLFSR